MKRALLIACGLLPSLAYAIQLPSVVVNFSDANNGQGTGYATSGGYNLLYYGQGAYSDPGNNIWNGFGSYPGAGSTYFYGAGLTDNPQQSGNPGNPYAAYNPTGSTTGWQSSSGNNLFSPSHYSTQAGNATSSGSLSPVTLSMSYNGGDNGLGNVGQQHLQGTPNFLLGEAAIVNGGVTGTFGLGNVPAGTYNLYLYGGNYDNTRGAAFTVSSGTAVNGLTSAINSGASGNKSFVLGQNYVEFTGVTPDANGNITGTWSAVSNPNSGLSGEGDFNGLQLVQVSVPEPTTMAMLGLGAASLLFFRRRK